VKRKIDRIEDDPCPCGRGSAYRACCGPFHRGLPAPDAEALMRSRYSAYVFGDSAYLLDTWHPALRPAELERDQEPVATRWLGLRIMRHQCIGPDTSEVEFAARYRIGGGPAQRLHEVSRFERIAGRWLYCDGRFTEPEWPRARADFPSGSFSQTPPAASGDP